MKRRVISFITVLAMCLSLCPMRALADGWEPDASLCSHHRAHTEECGYVPEDAGAPCAFVCRVCPIEDLVDELPRSVTPDNKNQVEDQLSAILALYTGLTASEQDQLDLSRCFDLQAQLDAANTPALIDGDVPDPDVDRTLDLDGDWTNERLNTVTDSMLINTHGYSYTATKTGAFQVQGTGRLCVMGGGAITSQKGSGVEVLTGGQLCISDSSLVVTGSTYGLDIASGAAVELSGGTYTGKTAAIQTSDNNFGALLKSGCAYFDVSGNPIPLTDVAAAKTVIVKGCTAHQFSYTHNVGTPTHAWTCAACGTAVTSEPCTFAFGQDEEVACICGDTITVALNEDDLADLVYDGSMKPENLRITVTLKDSSSRELVKDTDYTVACEPRADVGEITVTVAGITYIGTFTKTYYVTQAQPVINWNSLNCTVNYSGSPVKESDLPGVNITARDDLSQSLRYSYKGTADTDFIDGLPTNAGTYEIKASLPEQQNYKAAETNSCLSLTINRISAVITEPTAIQLTYNGAPQNLVTAGTVRDGAVIEFARSKGGLYSTDIPAETCAGDYEIWYRVADTENYIGVSETEIKNVLIQRKLITPTVELSSYKYLYDGGVKEPAVTVKDGETELPKSEYEVTYVNNRNVSTPGNPAKAVVTDAALGNYEIRTPGVEAEFRITVLEQAALSIIDRPNTVTYGDKFTLSTLGGSGNGNVTWKITNGTDVAAVNEDSGQVTIIGHGWATVQATKSGTYNGVTNYEDAIAVWRFTADQKPVVASVTAEDKAYDETAEATVHAVVEEGVLPGDEIKITGLTGQFSDENAGTSKTVTVDTRSAQVSGTRWEHYAITYSSAPVEASITKAPTSIKTAPLAKNLTYIGSDQALVEAGEANAAAVQVEYSLDEKGEYSPIIPTAVNAGTYIVWYKVADSVNYTGTSPTWVTAKIGKADPNVDGNPTASPVTSGQPLSQSILTGSAGSVSGTFAWVDGDIVPEDGKLYEARFIPDDTVNYNTVTFDVPVTVTDPGTDGGTSGGDTDGGTGSGSGTDGGASSGSGTDGSTSSGSGTDGSTSSGSGTENTGNSTNTNSSPAVSGPSTVSAAMQTSVQSGTATTILNAAAGNKLVRETVASQSANVVIKPEIAGNVTKANVSIPTSTISQLGSKTNADLTVSTPVADVTIPNAALGTLSSAGGAVNVVTEQVENTVALTLSAGGQSVESVPGGLTLTVPVEDASPGTVAVLVHDDGTRETVRKAVAEDGKISVRLDGPATVEIVDNSREFTDVSEENWAADAIAFASAHELFNGTSQTTFSPDEPMSRAMLATVLYNLEGRPAQSPASGFSDVSGDAWYAEGVSWAVENGIANGYGDDQFGPNDNITREQFAVMLWKYAGNPASNGEPLNFTDADQASTYAIEALRWAAANGILNGYGNSQLDPSGSVTRAQAAQMLKNFMENT